MRQILIVLLAFVSLEALSQPQLPPGVRGPDSGLATRSVSTYLALERGLLVSLKEGNRDEVMRVLGDGFEVRSSVDMNETSAADWLQGELRNPIETAGVRNLSVHEINDIAVVSFLLDSKRVVNNKSVASTLYLVDIWSQPTHQLVARYVSRPAHAAPVPARPSGRE
jgi:hypothetical protein